jgi:hypothetical protein
MRTTIRLDNLFARLKKRASESATSVSQLIEQAVALLMQPPPLRRRKSSFKLVTFGAGGRFSRLNIDKTFSLLEADDLDRFAQRP